MAINIKDLAKVLHHNFAGITDDCYRHFIGEKRRSYEQLEQHEQDDLEYMAQAVIKYLDDNKLIRETK